MSKVSQKIPDQDVLYNVVQEQLQELTQTVREQVGDLENEYLIIRRRQRIGNACLVVLTVIFIVLYAILELEVPVANYSGDIMLSILTVVLLIVISGLSLVVWRLIRDPSRIVHRFNQGINQVLFPAAAGLFGLVGQYVVPSQVVQLQKQKSFRIYSEQQKQTNVSLEHKQIHDLLDHSELITEPRNEIIIDDMMHIPWGQRSLFIAELSVKHKTSSGKTRKVKDIFHGYFVSFDLVRPLAGKTFISSEGDKKGFGHKSFWKQLTNSGVKETLLEWNDFENLLHVATTDPTEARYILTPDFMAELHDWWLQNQGNIRLSFIGTRLYILFPETGIQFNKTVPALNETYIKEYLLTIATPLMRVLHLIERIK